MVHPYLRRRRGVEKVEYPSPAPPHDPDELRGVLGKTLGVPLFQEAGDETGDHRRRFPPPRDANRLRRAMATFRNLGTIDQFREKMVEGMVRRGYERDFRPALLPADRGVFGSYGFSGKPRAVLRQIGPMSRPGSKCHQPAVFACALLNSQPMGFYGAPPRSSATRAASMASRCAPIDVNASIWDNSLERDAAGRLALRLGFPPDRRLSRDLGRTRIVAAREPAFDGIERLAPPGRPAPARAAPASPMPMAFRSIGIDRRAALWEVRRTPDAELPLFRGGRAPPRAGRGDGRRLGR